MYAYIKQPRISSSGLKHYYCNAHDVPNEPSPNTLINRSLSSACIFFTMIQCFMRNYVTTCSVYIYYNFLEILKLVAYMPSMHGRPKSPTNTQFTGC